MVGDIQTVISLIVSGIAVVFILIGVWGSFQVIRKGMTRPDFHPLQVMCLFFASGGAFVLTTLFRTTDGPIDVDLSFMHFKGASGPILMWILAFVAICTGMKMLNLDK